MVKMLSTMSWLWSTEMKCSWNYLAKFTMKVPRGMGQGHYTGFSALPEFLPFRV